MNWNAVAAIAELVGAAGVVATLLYLATQVRQNTKALRATTFQSIVGFATGFAESVAQNGDLAAIFETGMADFESLNETDRLRFHFQLVALLRRYENMHYQSYIGLLEDEQWEGLRASLNHMILRPGSRAWWKSNSHLFNSSFRDFVERRFSESDAQHNTAIKPTASERVARSSETA